MNKIKTSVSPRQENIDAPEYEYARNYQTSTVKSVQYDSMLIP